MAYKHDYDKALTRLVSILTKLYNGETLLVKDLALEFNVSTRTILRDLNERLISFPIYKDGKYWKMQNGFKLEKSTSIEDQVVLDIMEKLVDGVGTKFSSKAKTLLSKIKNDELNPIYTKLNIEDIGDKLDVVQELESAIKINQIIGCNYKIEDNKTYILKLKPLKIVNFEGFWYLIALDTKDNDNLKKYYLKNIFGVKTIDKYFNVSSKLEQLLNDAVSIWFQDKTEAFEVKINVSNVVSKYVQRKPIAPTQIVESSYEDGSLDIIIKVTHEMEVLPIVKYWLPYMRVIEPKWIDELICDQLKEYIQER